MSSQLVLKLTTLSLVGAIALGGCGNSSPSSSDAAATTSAEVVGQSTPTPSEATTPAATSPASNRPVGRPQGRWAERLCTAMQGRVSAIQPPQVDTSSPQATLASLRKFFADLAREQGGQLSILDQVGPPPGASAAKAWRATRSQLRGVRADVLKVGRELRSATVDSAADVQALTARIGTQMQSVGAYAGPVAQLVADPEVGPALARESSCARFR